jgi:hypothetical protein
MNKEPNLEPLWNYGDDEYGFDELSYNLTITLSGEFMSTGISEEHVISKIQKILYSKRGGSDIIDWFVKEMVSEVGISFKAEQLPTEEWEDDDV